MNDPVRKNRVLTAREQAIFDTYTEQSVHHQVILKVKHQSFKVGDPSESAEHATWMRKMLSVALERMIHYERG